MFWTQSHSFFAGYIGPCEFKIKQLLENGGLKWHSRYSCSVAHKNCVSLRKTLGPSACRNHACSLKSQYLLNTVTDFDDFGVYFHVLKFSRKMSMVS